MKRLAAMHDWPLLIVRALTAVAAALPRSAEGSTMNGSLPPNSSTAFLTLPPAARPTATPAPSLPVSVTAAMRGSSIIFATAAAADEKSLEAARREAGAGEDLGDGERRLRHVRGVLQDADVARHERRRGEAQHLPEREVPRHHRQHAAERVIAHEAPRGVGRDLLRREEALRRARRSSGRPRRTSRPRRPRRRWACPSRAS